MMQPTRAPAKINILVCRIIWFCIGKIATFSCYEGSRYSFIGARSAWLGLTARDADREQYQPVPREWLPLPPDRCRDCLL